MGDPTSLPLSCVPGLKGRLYPGIGRNANRREEERRFEGRIIYGGRQLGI